jgi:hypothetical protein
MPYVCETVPPIVDRIDPPVIVEYFGYDFDLLCRKLYLEKLDGTRTDVTYALDMLTHYHMTVNLSLVAITSQDVRFVLTCDEMRRSEVISSLGIIQDSTEEIHLNIGAPEYLPPHTRGDREFNGNGPKVWCEVSIAPINNATQLQRRIWMKAEETKSDWTTAEGTEYFPIYTAEPGKQIKHILTGTHDNIYYVDDDHLVDIIPRGLAGLVNEYIFIGDTPGDDAGIDTKVAVAFNEIIFLVGFIDDGFADAEPEDYELVILKFDGNRFVEEVAEEDAL